jgi:hypothetical protein
MKYFSAVMTTIPRLATQASGLVTKVVGERSADLVQTVTILSGRDEVDKFWRDPENLSQAFGNLATVQSSGSDVFVWKLQGKSDETQSWRTRLQRSDNALWFVADGPDGDTGDRAQLMVTYQQAPNGLGTEVTLTAASPLRDFVTQGALFQVLYRARALLQTGEIPTLSHNPSPRETTH